MANTLANLVVKITGDTAELVKDFNKTEKKTGDFASGVSKKMKLAGAAGATALAGIGIAGVKMAVDVEKGLREVQTLLPGLSEQGFNKLRADVFDLSKEVGIATNEIIPALYQAISAGVPQDNVMEFMRVASDAAIGGVTELQTAVDGITSAVNVYGRETLNAQEASDLMFNAVKLGKTTFEELSSSLSNVLPVAKSAGVDFETVTAALASMTAAGVPTAQATTQLRAAISALSAPTKEQQTLLSELNLTNLDAVLKNEGLAAALEDV